MEKLRKAVNQIAYTPPSQRLSTLSPLQLSLIPLLSLSSQLYRLALFIRHHFYHLGFFRKHRLPVPVISVGNLTWGGNGKTPMVEFIARWLADSGISPLILTRVLGYGGADEAKMLQRHLFGTSAKVGVGANRAATAAVLLEKYGYIDFHCNTSLGNSFSSKKAGSHSLSDKIGAAILDDGMQVSEQRIEAIQSTVRDVSESLPVFLSKMAPLYFLKAGNAPCKLSLGIVHDSIVLCVSGIGFAESFVQTIMQMGSKHVDRLDFSDHHLFQTKDIKTIRMRLEELESEFAVKPFVVITEKDYDRAPEVLKDLDPYEVLVLCSCLEFLPQEGQTKGSIEECLRQHFKRKII